MVKSVQIINDPENFDFLGLLITDEYLKIENMSSFERFVILCSAFVSVRESDIGGEFFDALSAELGEDIPKGIDTDREVQKAVWRKINGDADISVDIAKVSAQKAVDCIYADEKLSVADLELLLNESTVPELDGFIDSLLKYDAILVNVENFIYERPDEYHSVLAYKKLISGCVPSASEYSLLVAWIICRASMQKNTMLFFAVKDGLTELERLLLMLEGRRVFPNIRICFSEPELCDGVSDLCLGAEQKNISSEIILSEETSVDDICFLIKKLAKKLPLTRISACRVLSTEKQKNMFKSAIKRFTKDTEGI
jgi:hypothetical protein